MLEKIRNQVAKDSAFDDWDDLCFCHGEMESIKRFEELTKFCDEVSQRYAQSQTQELQEQNAELVKLVERCRDVIQCYNNIVFLPRGKEIIDAITDRLTKYNHLNRKDVKP